MKYLIESDKFFEFLEDCHYKCNIVSLIIPQFSKRLREWEYLSDFKHSIHSSLIKRVVFALTTVNLCEHNYEPTIIPNKGDEFLIVKVPDYPELNELNDIQYYALHRDGILKLFYAKILDSYTTL